MHQSPHLPPILSAIDSVLQQVNVILPWNDGERLTPQLPHPQLEQLPEQLEQVAQVQGCILVNRGIGKVGSWLVVFVIDCFVCGLVDVDG